MVLAEAGEPIWSHPPATWKAHQATPGGTEPLNALASKRLVILACGGACRAAGHGRQIDDLSARPGGPPGVLAENSRRIVRFVVAPTLGHGVFYGDPHLGNLLVKAMFI